MFLQSVRLALNYMLLQPRTYSLIREISPSYFSHHNLLVFAWVNNCDHIKYWYWVHCTFLILLRPCKRLLTNAKVGTVLIEVKIISVGSNHAELKVCILCIAKPGHWRSIITYTETTLHTSQWNTLAVRNRIAEDPTLFVLKNLCSFLGIQQIWVQVPPPPLMISEIKLKCSIT
jgi:hypothetical protein